MFLINLCLAHQNVVFKKKAYKKTVMLHNTLMKSTPEDCNSEKSDRLRIRVGCKIWKLIAITPVRARVCSTLEEKIILGFCLFFSHVLVFDF